MSSAFSERKSILSRSVDTVRASRDGHEFHEAWTARKALQLLLPTDNLVGIAVEGLHPEDHTRAASETVEIADIVLYYGKRATFRGAKCVNIVQFKYSVSHSDVDFRSSHARKTILKFAEAYRDHKRNYCAKEVQEKLKFELITNRPIYPAFEQAITSIAEKKKLCGEVGRQAAQFKAACALKGRPLIEFASKIRIIGLAGSLRENKGDLSRTLVDWSAANDAMARARLGALKQLVRDKAGTAGNNRNVIRCVDVLAALDLQDIEDLLPCPANFPSVGPVVQREQLAEAIALIPKLDKALLVHAAGGVGKTVFLESLANSISDNHEVLIFDCFGGGAYRDPADSRHLPKRGLVHIVNTLACRGLCDPVLPSNNLQDDLLRTFRRRLEQCVETLRRASSERDLVLFVDAVDNAAVHARDRGEDAFPALLLKSLHHGGPIPGIHLVVSCRTHRMELSKGDTECVEFQLEPFSEEETGTYLRYRLKNVTQTEIQVAQARSGGNPRILEHLVSSDRGLLDTSEIDKRIELGDLLKKRIEEALSDARNRGHTEAQLSAFLAGLSELPPPVPLDEYAGAQGMDVSIVESFSADMAPLLERTKHGLMLRDEPTETLIRENYAANNVVLRHVAENLLRRQEDSVYAARALPGLLYKLGDGKRLFDLAFDERFPQSITSTIGKQSIRYARLKAAVRYAVDEQDHNRLVHLLVELSTIAAFDERGASYILDCPDLVIAAQDVDATRRLFESRTDWPGTRHARLAIASTLSGDLDDAYRHAVSADEWITHYRQLEREPGVIHVGPEPIDIAAVPLCLIVQNRSKDAISFMRGWTDWYSYEVGEHLFRLARQAEPKTSQAGSDLGGFFESLTDEIGLITSVLSFLELDDKHRCLMLKKLSRACRKTNSVELNSGHHRNKTYLLQDGLLKASVIAASLGLIREAGTICRRIPIVRPRIYYFDSSHSMQDVFPFLVLAALRTATKEKALRVQDILPAELVGIGAKVRNASSTSDFGEKLLKKLKDEAQKNHDQASGESKPVDANLQKNGERFINRRSEWLLRLTKALSEVFRAPVNRGDKAFLALLREWEEVGGKRNNYLWRHGDHFFFQQLGRQFLTFALWARSDLKNKSLSKFTEYLLRQDILSASILIELVEILAERPHSPVLAGETALKAQSLIERESDVDHRTSLYASLARAILPASSDEASAYFKAGLEQMDAIGSGDYDFINELLQFASTLEGSELAEQDFHALANICELNMPEDGEKFPWGDFSKGMSRTAGCKGLAKLGRWDDRSMVALNCTLLPYLTALILDEKIEPEIAMALLRLSNPLELWVCDTKTLAKAIEEKDYPSQAILVSELIRQFEENSSGILMDDTLKALASIAERTLGKRSETTAYLAEAHKRFAEVRNERNENMGQRGKRGSQFSKASASTERKNKTKLRKLAAGILPNDADSLATAVDELHDMGSLFGLKEEFFGGIRSRVAFPDRHQYIRIVAELENLTMYERLDELRKCKEAWNDSSAALTHVFEELGVPLVRRLSDDNSGSKLLSVYDLKQVSDLSGIPIAVLGLELIKIFSSPGFDVPASVWLDIASIVSAEAEPGEGQQALTRLLNGNSAKLASSVADGEWKEGLYPPNDQVEIAAGLVWLKLGAPSAAERWRAAHSVRRFAKFERWDVIDALVARLGKEDAHPFQAPELPFYFLHARLWLLIALARLAKDAPKNIARYGQYLKEIIIDDESPHVLMRHFAAQTILGCNASGSLKLSLKEKRQIAEINLSPFPQLKQKAMEAGKGLFYWKRPDHVPKPDPEFSLEYDFEKHDVQSLGYVFGKQCWEVKDMIGQAVHGYNEIITDMHDSGGRESNLYNGQGEMTSKYHTYGQMLAWHSLFLTAGRLLSDYPVTEDSYEEDPWQEWLNRQGLLTRQDGLWLSDGKDRPPLAARVNLLERGKDELVITGDKAKLLRLIGMEFGLEKEIVVHGRWSSLDDIKVHIGSALVEPRRARAFVRQLIEEEPFSAYIPSYEEHEDASEFLRNSKMDCKPWIVCPDMDTGLDGEDRIGHICAVQRPRFAKGIARTLSLATDDPFGRIWKNSAGKPRGHSDAWNSEGEYSNGQSDKGVRLVCSNQLLRDVLTRQNSDLVILIHLQRYEKDYITHDCKFSNTIAVVRIKKTLAFEFHRGAVNHFP